MIALPTNKSAESSGKNCLIDYLAGNTPRLPAGEKSAISSSSLRPQKKEDSTQDGHPGHPDDFFAQLSSFCESTTTVTVAETASENSVGTANPELPAAQQQSNATDASMIGTGLTDTTTPARFAFLSSNSAAASEPSIQLPIETTRPTAGDAMPTGPQPQGSLSTAHTSPAAPSATISGSETQGSTAQLEHPIMNSPAAGESATTESQPNDSAPAQAPFPGQVPTNATSQGNESALLSTALDNQPLNQDAPRSASPDGTQPQNANMPPVSSGEQSPNSETHDGDEDTDTKPDPESDAPDLSLTIDEDPEPSSSVLSFLSDKVDDLEFAASGKSTADTSFDRILAQDPQQAPPPSAGIQQAINAAPMLSHTPHQMIMNLQALREQFDVLALQALRSDDNQIRIELEPLMLGRLVMTCRETANGLELNINTQSEEVRQIIAQQEQNLRANLESQGLQLGQFSVATEDRSDRRQPFPQLADDDTPALPTRTTARNATPIESTPSRTARNRGNHWIA